jgi:hypothetical protein
MYYTAKLPGVSGGRPVTFSSWRSAPARRRALAAPMILTPQPGGLGAATLTTQLLGGITAGTALGTSTGMSTGSIFAGSAAAGLAVIAPFTGPAAPFLMAAAALIGPIASLFKGCGASCTQSSKYADQAQAAAEQLSKDYWAQPVRYKSTQTQTLAYLDQVAGWLRQSCSDPSLGAAGQRCISERLVRGGTAPWCPSADHTGCDFYTTLYDPIANDTGVVPDPGPVDTAASGVLSSLGVNPSATVAGFSVSNLALAGAAAVAAFFLFGGSE